MTGKVHDTDDLADRLRAALDTRDLDAFGTLLSDDVRWGSDDHPRACRNRSNVLATFARIMSEGAEGAISELAVETEGILCGLTGEHVSHPGDEFVGRHTTAGVRSNQGLSGTPRCRPDDARGRRLPAGWSLSSAQGGLGAILGCSGPHQGQFGAPARLLLARAMTACARLASSESGLAPRVLDSSSSP